MTIKSYYLIAVLLILSVWSCKDSSSETNEENSPSEDTISTPKIISLNGALTEIVYELGLKKSLIGKDVTATYPEYVRDSVEDLGHVRSINVESLMELNPDMILASAEDMNDDLKKSIQESGTDFKIFQQEYSVEGTKNLVDSVADYLSDFNIENKTEINRKIDEDMASLKSFAKKPKVLFVYARGAGTLMVAGKDTPMQKMIELAGAENAIMDFSDFKPLTEEALLKNNPDVILLFDSGLESLGNKDGLIKTVPGVMETNAGKNKAIIAMDGALLSGFGPRVGQAAIQLNELLMPYAE